MDIETSKGIGKKANGSQPLRPISQTEVESKTARRRFTKGYKLSILERAVSCSNRGEIGKLLRQEGLYSSHLSVWRGQRREGTLEALGRARGPKPGKSSQVENELRGEVVRRRKLLVGTAMPLAVAIHLGFIGCGNDNPTARDAGGCKNNSDCELGHCQPDGSCVCPASGSAPAPAPWTRTAGAPLLVPGQSHVDGQNFLLADPSALYERDSDSWRLWYAASRGLEFISSDNRAVIEVAESNDALSWSVQEAVALDLSGVGWDAIRTETPDVIIDPAAPAARRYIMAYSGADVILGLGFPNYNVGIAFSADGKTFTRVPANESPHGEAGFVLREQDAFPALPTVNGGVVADPTLVLHDDVYHIWFSSFGCGDGDTCADIRAFGVSHATSTDAIHWIADPANPVVAGAEQPSVLWNHRECQFEMWFTKDAPGEEDAIPSTFNPSAGTFRATSADGTSWTVDTTRDFVWDGSEPGEDLGLLTGVDVALKEEQRILFYVGMGTMAVPPGFFIPVQTSFDVAGFVSGTFGLGLATQ